MNWLRLERVAVPANPISLSLVRQHLREDSTEQDELIDLYVRAAADTIEGPDGAGIALNSQQWDLWLDCFPAVIKVPIGPLVSVESITYTDTEGAEQTVASADYEVDALRGLIRPVDGAAWPSTDLSYNAIKVRVNVGYADGALPSDLQVALLLVVGHLYENREQVSAVQLHELPMGARSIIERYRRGRFA